MSSLDIVPQDDLRVTPFIKNLENLYNYHYPVLITPPFKDHYLTHLSYSKYILMSRIFKLGLELV